MIYLLQALEELETAQETHTLISSLQASGQLETH